MQPPIHHRYKWKCALRIALPALLALILVDMLLYAYFSWIPHTGLELGEILLSGFLFLDILLNLHEAHNKYSYFQRNFLRIIVVFPFALVFRVLWILELETLLSPVILGEWMPTFIRLQKFIKLEESTNILARLRGFFFGING